MRGVVVATLLLSFLAVALGYSVTGNKLYGPDGKAILLRGVARPSLEWNANGEGLSNSDYQLIKSWGSNVVRLSLSQCFWLSDTSGYKSRIATQVSQIKALGLGVILDLHWSDKGVAGGSCGQQKHGDSRSVTFWQQVATAYKNDAWVIFELYNEPHDVSWSVWLNGGDTGDGYNTPGFKGLYNAVRGTGANNVVLIGGLNYAYDLSGLPANAVPGTNIAYVTHPYNFGGKQPADWPAGFGFLASQYHIVITEFGTFDCSTDYYNKLIAYADTNEFSYTAWAWYPGGCGFPAVINDWGGSPNAPGSVLKNHLLTGKKAPGGSGSTTAKSTTGTSTTAKSTTSTTGSSTTGSSGTKISVVTNPNTNQYWIAIDAINGGSQATQTIQIKDSQSGQAYVTTVKESWGSWSWSPNRIIVPPLSVKLTSTGGKSVEINNVITSINGGATYSTSSQYP